MSSNKQQPTKRPSGGRPIVRRLFSKDSLSSPNLASAELVDSPLSVLQELSLTTEDKPWIGGGFVSSPTLGQRDVVTENSSGSTTPSSGVEGNTPSSLHAPIPKRKKTKPSLEFVSLHSASTSPPPPFTPSKARWDQLRHHVLPSVSSVTSKSSETTPPVASPPATFTSFSHLNLLNRPSTPKTSRLARFAFRQVVNEARLVADDLTRRFSDDIQRACWAARFEETVKTKAGSKAEREGTHPGAFTSALSLPFKSTTSLPQSNAHSSNSSKVQGLRRPPSGALNHQVPNSRANALSALQNVIIRYASVANNKETTYLYLPHERDVLSVLLAAFLSRSTGRIADDERRLSMEIFETIIRAWKAPHSDVRGLFLLDAQASFTRSAGRN